MQNGNVTFPSVPGARQNDFVYNSAIVKVATVAQRQAGRQQHGQAGKKRPLHRLRLHLICIAYT